MIQDHYMKKLDKCIMGTLTLTMIMLLVDTDTLQVRAGTGLIVNTTNDSSGKTQYEIIRQNDIKNITSFGSTSQLQNRTSAIAVEATLSPLQAFPTNNLVNTRAFYDISFKTASTSTIGEVLLTFPVDTVVSQAAIVGVRA